MADDPALIIAMPAIAIRDAGAAWAKTIARQMPVGDVVTKSDKTERSGVISVATRRSRERTPGRCCASIHAAIHGPAPMRHSRSQAAALKAPISPAADESSVTAEQLAAAIRAATAMDIKEKERVCDTIYAAQPNLLGSVLVLRSFGISMPTIEIVLDILIVIHLAIVESGQVLATVTEDDLDRELSRYTASVRFSEGLDAASFMRSLEQTTAYRKESLIFAYVLSTLTRSGIATRKEEKAKFPMLAAINLVNCIATAKRLHRR